jgi:hypothetical protein
MVFVHVSVKINETPKAAVLLKLSGIPNEREPEIERDRLNRHLELFPIRRNQKLSPRFQLVLLLKIFTRGNTWDL